MKSVLVLMVFAVTVGTLASADQGKARPMVRIIGHLAFYKWAGNEMAFSTAAGKVGKVFVNCKAGLKNPFKIYLQVGETSVESPGEQRCIEDLRRIKAADLNSPVTVYLDRYEVE
jgi:hypothetical protein